MKLKELNTPLNENVQSSPYELLRALNKHFSENPDERKALDYVRISPGLLRQDGSNKQVAVSALNNAITILVPAGEPQGTHFGQVELSRRYKELFDIMRDINTIQNSDAYIKFTKDVSNSISKSHDIPPYALKVIEYVDKLKEMSNYGSSLYDELLDTGLWITYSEQWIQHLWHLIDIVKSPPENTGVDTEMDVSLIKGCLRQLGFKL